MLLHRAQSTRFCPKKPLNPLEYLGKSLGKLQKRLVSFAIHGNIDWIKRGYFNNKESRAIAHF
jgi:hypothetical protein